jgi:hypothetical protein
LKFTSFEDFLAGDISNGGSQFAGNSQRTTHQNNHSFYFQDNLRVTRKLTVNLGPSQLTAEDEGKVRDAVAKARD